MSPLLSQAGTWGTCNREYVHTFNTVCMPVCVCFMQMCMLFNQEAQKNFKILKETLEKSLKTL